MRQRHVILPAILALLLAGCSHRSGEECGPVGLCPAPAGTIEGVVLDALDGSPVAGAVVTRVRPEPDLSVPWTVVTGGDGRYRLEGIPLSGPTEFQVSAGGGGYVERSLGGALTPEAPSAVVNFLLFPSLPPTPAFGFLLIRVTDGAGAAAPGTPVTIQDFSDGSLYFEGSADAEGRLAPPGRVPPGVYRIVATGEVSGAPFVATALTTVLPFELMTVELVPNGAFVGLRNVPRVVASGDSFAYAVSLDVNGVLTDLVVRDTLDAELGGLTADRVTIDRAAFPTAQLTVDPGGRSFSIALGTPASTSGLVQLLEFRVARPAGEGDFCTKALATGREGAAVRRGAGTACVSVTTNHPAQPAGT